MGILLVLLLLVPGCTGDDDPKPSAEEQADLFVYASERLPDELLEEAAPAGFEVKQIVRHGPKQTANPWVTVGARMKGPVSQSRAIFYVHADELAALALHVDQVEQTKRAYEFYEQRPFPFDGVIPPVFEIEGDGVTGTCGVRTDHLFWCHAQKGRLYMLVQSSAGDRAGKGPVTDEQVKAARTVTAAFMELL